MRLRSLPAAALAVVLLLACGGGGPTGDGGPADVPCRARLARLSAGEIVHAGLVLGNGDRRGIDWSADGGTLLVRAIPGVDPCAAPRPPIASPVVLALGADGRGARPVMPLAGETSGGVLTEGGRAVLYLTPTARVGGLDVYGLVRVRFAGGADTLLGGLPRPSFTAVDSGGRRVAYVAPGRLPPAGPYAPDTLVTIEVATGARRAILLDGVGHTVLGMDPEGARVWAGERLVRLADGAVIGRLPHAHWVGDPPGRVIATRWQPDGPSLLVQRDGALDVVRVSDGRRTPVARPRGPVVPGAADWLPDGSVLALERLVDEDLQGDAPMLAVAVRRFGPDDLTGREVARGWFARVPGEVRAAPDGRRMAITSPDVVAVVPLR
jgi:hypothetical protein